MLSKISVVIDEYIAEYHLDAIALRCWNEMETYLRVCPCVLLTELNDRGITASCEIDMCSAITMRALSLARGGFKHHTTVANGHVKAILEEAFKYYLGYDVVSIEG